MNEVLAHITQFDLPTILVVACAGFLGGVAVTYAMLARRMK
jgi:hypothetical protein